MNDALKELIDFLGVEAEDIKGPQGEKGDPGERGASGQDGKDGRDGVDGKDGRDGTDGKNGKDGERGPAGRDGRDGIDGKDGERGPAGKAGPPGRALMGWGAHPLIVQEEGVVKDKVTRVLNFKGSGVSVARTLAGVTEVTVSGGGAGATDWGDIGGTLSNQTDLQTALNAKEPLKGADDNYVTDAEKVVIGNTSGTNTGDQTSIVGITGTKAQFDTAVTDGNFLYVGDITAYTDEMAQDAVGNAVGGGLDYDDASGTIFVDETELVAGNLIGFEESAQDAVGGMVDTTLVYTDLTPQLSRAALTGAITASAGSNTTALGSFTKAQLDTAVSDGNVLYVGDVTQYTDEMAQDAIGNAVGNGLDYDDASGAISVDETELAAASIGGFTEAAQDAVGAMVDTTLTYVDGTPLLQRAALTGAITASAGSNTTALGSFTLSQLNTAVSDANIIPEAGGTFTGDVVVPDEAYGSSWDGSLEVPTKNALYDIISILGGVAITRTIVTTIGDVTMGDTAAVDYVYVRNSDHVLTFPTAVGNTNRYTIKNRHSSPCTPRTNGTETIDGRSQVNGASTNALVIFPNEAYDFLSDGNNWYTI